MGRASETCGTTPNIPTCVMGEERKGQEKYLTK